MQTVSPVTYTTTTTTSAPRAMTSYTVPSGPYHSMVTHGDDPNFYKPEGTEYVAPGRTLRGGMQPLYSMHEVRTYEAAPIFQSHPVIYAQDRGGMSHADSESRHGHHMSTSKKSTANKRKLCC